LSPARCPACSYPQRHAQKRHALMRLAGRDAQYAQCCRARAEWRASDATASLTKTGRFATMSAEMLSLPALYCRSVTLPETFITSNNRAQRCAADVSATRVVEEMFRDGDYGGAYRRPPPADEVVDDKMEGERCHANVCQIVAAMVMLNSITADRAMSK